MAKLSQQLAERQQTPTRQTRTQRVAQQQEIAREKTKFENLKAQAQKKQEELAGATFEEYEQEYLSLSPDLQQFFSSPAEVLEQKAERISETKQSVQDKIAYADQKIAERKEYYANKIKKKEEWWASKSSKYRNKENKDGVRYRKERYKEDLDEYEDDLEEDIAKYQGLKKGLQEGLKQLNQDKDVAYRDIENYAWDVADYEERREEARNERSAIKRKQRREIKRLEEQGFKPYVIEKSFKGNPQGVSLSYYNQKTGQWKNVADFEVKGKVDVSNLKRVGFSAPTTRTLTFGGKDFKFTSRVGVYKESDGDLVTPYAKTGLNENVLIKQQQDKAFKEWEASQKNKPITVPFKVLTAGKELPADYGQGTIMTDGSGKTIPPSIIISEKDYYAQKDRKTDFGILSKGIDKVVSGFKWVDERVHYTGDLSLIKFGKVDKPTDPERISQQGIDFLSKKSQDLEDWAIGKDKIKEFEGNLETKFEGQYQSAFEQKYMKSLIYNETTFEKASEEFSKSDEAKLIQRRYQEEYETGYKDLQISPSYLKKFGAGSGRVGLSLASLGLKVVSSPTKTATGTAGVITGVKVLGALPTVASYGLSGGLFVYGTAKAVSPTSTIDEAGSGLVTAVLSGATLGYAGYRYLKAPVVKTKLIKPPKATLRSSEIIGKDLKIITKQGTINKVVFSKQKISQVGTIGRRTIVTTKGRELLAKYTKFKPAPIYRGVPTEQLGKVTRVTGLRGTVVTREPSGYQKAFNLLKKYGYTESQARSTLRYIAPRVTEQYLNKGIITIKGSKAVGEFEYLTKRPVIDVDKSFGIKTRGAKTIKDVYDVQRKLVNIKGTNVALEEKTGLSFFIDKKGRLFDLKDFGYSKGFSVAKSSDLRKGYEFARVGKLDVFKEAEYRDILRSSVERKLFPQDNILRVDFGKTKLFKQVIDLSKESKFVPPANIKKTPFASTFGKDQTVKDIIKKISKTPKSDNFNKVVEKLDDIGSAKLPSQVQSQYYGTGQYEQSIGGLTPTQTQQLQQQLKTAPIPSQIKGVNLKDLIKVKSLDLTLSKVGQLSAIKTMTQLKSDIKLKSELKVANNLKVDVKTDSLLKADQLPALKSSPALKSQLKTLLELGSATTSVTPPSTSFRPPKIPTIRPPTPKPLVVLFPSRRGAGSDQALKKAITERAYLPDFTSRALGLAPETVTQKQAQKKLKKLLTGLEIRRGVQLI